MKPPKILAVASAIDLDFRYGCTPAWWQLWKGMYEAGVDLIMTPYRGRQPEFGGMDTGFNIYHGADPSECDMVISNSEGGIPRLLEPGAKRAEAILWGAAAVRAEP